MAGAGSWVELQHSASLLKTFPVGWVVRNTENKAQLRPAVAGALTELGKNWYHKQRGLENVKFCRLPFPSFLAQITSSQHSSWPLTHINAMGSKNEP